MMVCVMYVNNIEIYDNVYGGYGIGRLDNGKVVFVPFGVKGDIANIKIKEEKKSFSYGELIELVKPSHHRVDGFCKYIGVCGGCSYGFLDDDFEIEVKRRIVENSFRNISDFKIDEYVHSNKRDYRVRCRMRLKWGGLFYKKFNSNELVSIDECPILKPSILNKLKDVAGSYSDTDCDISIIENEKGEELIFLDSDIDITDSKYNIKSKRCQKGLKSIEFNINKHTIPAGYRSFFQTNRYLFESFQRKVVEQLKGYETVLEFYCGSGFFTIPLSKEVRKIVAIDQNDEALRLLKQQATGRAEVLNTDLKKDIINIKGRFDAVLVNPDRDGLSKGVLKVIMDKKPEIIVYVSCNPQTMSRDIKNFMNRYKMCQFTVVDQFYKTYHIESIAVLTER
ncbi:class I SAM-dependent RNA methyltransferase [Calditerrivibrio nitroreducens]|nr:TRAM domain-containing protein [Calditerrivibrio nitroreducens]